MNMYDAIVIGLGPAGMAVTAMASAMGLTVCAVEKHRIGGECSNVGCIPSKGLLKMAKRCQLEYNPFTRLEEHVTYIREKKMAGALKKAEIISGEARFTGKQEIEVDGRRLTAKHIFIAAGTRPSVPDIPGLADVPFLTNETVFSLPEVPASMTIFGGGPIGVEMALAFHRLGCACTIIGRAAHLVPKGDPDAGKLLQERYRDYGITVLTKATATRVEEEDGAIVVTTASGDRIRAEKLLVATGRKTDFSGLNLEAAGVEYGPRGITVDKRLRTSNQAIFAIGDCNGHYLLSHAAMHQGMIAVMNLFLPGPFKKDFTRYPVPWTVFTDPEISQVGRTARELQAQGIPFQVVESSYADYGASIVQEVPHGHIRVFTNKRGKILGVSIVGEHSGEMINEWALAMQNKLSLFKVMMTMHSFPTMGFLSKRIGESWMMDMVQRPFIQKLLRRFAPK